MLRYTLSRLGQFVVMLFMASVATFLVIQHAPGDPARVQLGLNATPSEVAIERQKLGLNASLPHRYIIWLTQAVHLNFGRSFATNLPVTQMIGSAFGYTVRLAALAIVLAVLISIPLGIVAALNRGKKTDIAVSAFAAAGMSLPSFALGTILILILAVHFRLLPSAGAGNPGQSNAEALKFVIMPALTLAIPFAAVLIRFIRVALSEAMEQDYIVTARAKGLRRWTVISQHGMRNAMIPTITVAGMQVGRLLAGAVITETVFSYPGLGYLTIQSIQGLDYPVVEGALILAAAIFLVLTFLVDLTYGLFDPRVRLA